MTVNEARKEMFTKKGRMIESIPPTKDMLDNHIKRAVYQGSYVWGELLSNQPILPSPDCWGWEKNNNVWKPTWTTLPIMSKACQELIKCGCNPLIGCRGRCKCSKSNLPCTELCKCGGDCDKVD